MDQLMYASLSHTHYLYEVGMLKVSYPDKDYKRYLIMYLDPAETFPPEKQRWHDCYAHTGLTSEILCTTTVQCVCPFGLLIDI